jgi:hypothetical protein
VFSVDQDRTAGSGAVIWKNRQRVQVVETQVYPVLNDAQPS